MHHMVEVGFEKGFGCWIVKVSLLGVSACRICVGRKIVSVSR